MVRGWSAGVAAAVAIPLDTNTRMVAATLRIALSPSVGQAEFDPHASRKIHRLGVPLRRFELYFLSRMDRSLIQAVAQSADYTVHLNRTVSQKYHIQHHIAFDSLVASVCGVLRARFVKNFHHARR